MRISIPRRAFAAAINCAAKSDIRYYLNGILLRISEDKVMAAATDGHQLFACTFDADWEEGRQTATFDLIVPYDVAKESGKLSKKGPENIVLASTDSGHYMLGDRVFAPIDGRFPDISRVVPQPGVAMGEDRSAGQFNPDLISSASKALAVWFNMDKGSATIIHRGPSNAAVLCGFDNSAVAVVMPWRDTNDYHGFNFVPEKTPEQTKADLDALEARQC